MRVLVTGGCGFIGAGFCRRFRKHHPTLVLVNVDKLYPCSTQSPDLLTSSDNYYFRPGDIKDIPFIKGLLVEFEIDYVVHFAAQSHVDTSFSQPMLYTTDNVFGTHAILEACRSYGKLKKFVHISTDEVYGENKTSASSPFHEGSLLQPTNPYAASKAAAEMFVHSYIQSYSFPALVIRSNNVYGPGQYPEKVIPRFCLLLNANKKLTIAGTGSQLRSFLFLDDAVDAVLCVMFQGRVGEIYNVSSPDELSILELAKRMLAILKPGQNFENWIEYIEDRKFNDQRYWINAQPLKALGWAPKVGFAQGLQTTVSWFQNTDLTHYWIRDERSRIALVWGANGWIGGQFVKILRSRGWIVHAATSRADNLEAVTKEVRDTAATHLVSLIGRTHGPGFTTIDYLEQPGKLVENMQDNLYGPINLAHVARNQSIHFLYLGTGCIFQYDEEHKVPVAGADVLKFKETDKPNFFGSAYSTVKGYTDRILNENFSDVCLNVRIRMPISSEDGPRNFISKIIKYTNICSIPNSMTVLDDILPLLADCMEKGRKGTLNAVNPGVVDHHDILCMYRDLQNPAHTWKEIDNAELLQSFVKGARSNNFLDTSLLETWYPNVPSITTSVKAILTNHKFKGRE